MAREFKQTRKSESRGMYVGIFRDFPLPSGKPKILDLIPRSDQLELIKKSIGVIQPSLYEGGPGGFSAYEAIVFNKQLIISDIKINKEISYKNSHFYKK